jgi:hypothetical protein
MFAKPHSLGIGHDPLLNVGVDTMTAAFLSFISIHSKPGTATNNLIAIMWALTPDVFCLTLMTVSPELWANIVTIT